MSKEELIRAQLPHVLKESHFDFIGAKSEGKVRDSYVVDKLRYLVTTDRLSCFDVFVAHIPFKGQVLNQLAVDWFKKTEDIVRNHLIEVPDPNVMIVNNCEIIPVEVVIRGYLAGSAWRDYQKGKDVSGHKLPAGMKMSQKFDTPLMTPSTKAVKGEHDMPISEDQIVSEGLVETKVWEEIREKALALFARGTEEAAKQGLILVDTKYEFGLNGEDLILADEIHTLDCSRYWRTASYQERFESGQPPEMLDKEPVRQWLLSKGYQGEGEAPPFPEDYIVEVAQHYINSFEEISGSKFEPVSGDTHARIEKNLKSQLSGLKSEKLDNTAQLG